MTHESVGVLHNFLKTGITPSLKTQEFLKQEYLKYVDNKPCEYYNNIIGVLDNGKEFKTEHDWNISTVANTCSIINYNESTYSRSCTIAIWKDDYICYIYSNEFTGYIWDIHLFTPEEYRGNHNTEKYFPDLYKILSTITLLNDNEEMRYTTTIQNVIDVFSKEGFDEQETSDIDEDSQESIFLINISNNFVDRWDEEKDILDSDINEYVDEVHEVDFSYKSNVKALSKIWNWGV